MTTPAPDPPGPRDTVLVVEDEPLMRANLRELLGEAGYRVVEAATIREADVLRLEEQPTLALLDLKLPDGSGLALLHRWKANPAAAAMDVVVLTAFGGSQHAIEAMKLGAFDHLTKPFDADALLHVVHLAHRHRRAAADASSAAGATASEEHDADAGRGSAAPALVGQSPAMLTVYKRVGLAAPSDVPVLIFGESGTGKELVARALHQNSRRAGAPFVAVNCAAIPPELIESELFGHERGAFTGAVAQRQGVFERADGGTLFLDEIGDLGFGVQAKLLRVLQEGTFERVGGQRAISVRVRVVAATHRNLPAMVAEGRFREDLFYRLNVMEIQVPPLRERMDDFPRLVYHLVARHAPGRRAGVSDEAMRRLEAYRWPGNVRELENAVRHALLLARDQVIMPEHLPETLWEDGVAAPGAGAAAAGPTPEPLGAGGIPEGYTLRELLEHVEKRAIQQALQRAGGVRTQAAHLLGIHRRQLYEKMKQYGLEQ